MSPTKRNGEAAKPTEPVKVGQAKGPPMLSWVGKRPLREVRSYPAQLVERFSAPDGRRADSNCTLG